MGLMERREGDEFFQRLQHGRIHSNWLCVFESTMHDAMADADQRYAVELAAQIVEQVVERAGVSQCRSIVPGLFRPHFAGGILGNKPGSGVDAFYVAAHGEPQVTIALGKQLKLDAR